MDPSPIYSSEPIVSVLGGLVMEAKVVKEVLKGLGIRPVRALGQHFLLDKAVAQRLVDHANIEIGDTILEIGPGLGILTRLLSKKAKKVVAIEKDRRFMGLVDEPNVEYIQGDALKLDIPRVDKVVSNLPYSISSPITFKLLEGVPGFRSAILMYQREFAARLASGPGSKAYSRLSINAYVKAHVDLLEFVPKDAFYPRPKVDSMIVRLIPRGAPFETLDWDVFQSVVKAAFSQRRKKLKNSIGTGIGRLGTKETGKLDLEMLPYADQRPGKLTPEQFGEITDFLVSLER